MNWTWGIAALSLVGTVANIKKRKWCFVIWLFTNGAWCLYTAELDEKYCDVIVKRYIEQVGTSENVSVIRNGKTLRYEEVQTDGTE